MALNCDNLQLTENLVSLFFSKLIINSSMKLKLTTPDQLATKMIIYMARKRSGWVSTAPNAGKTN